MKILITKKCFVGNVLREEGEILDVQDASIYEGVGKVLGEVKKEDPKPEPKPIKPISKPIKKGTKK